ncbi:hypothetical protein N7492_008846 [Penicillium capsulatum]|uniref:DNA-directed RNA polymerase I subunit RPA34.5 n=1 Tax=Penicillium capsulatum TaxID=69766 RepID=A0A9W9LHB8_9EURO|nr:hypothetical protein N7492_008846 [Penicillium capsulatum]KAJ6106248.1 hypothetical protein N7512_009765 [Penicillium capsulatum]
MAPPSSSSDSSSSRSTSPEPVNKQKQALKGSSKAKEESEDASSSSGSESESDSESSNEMDTTEDSTESSLAKKPKVTGPQPYKAPSGFKSAKNQAPPSSNSASVLSNLRGKQVYHITAPSFLPLSKVKEISMSKIIKGKPLLSYEGVEYGIPAESFNDTGSEGKTLLVFDQKTQSYRRQTDQVPSYHIQELVGLPETINPDKSAVEALRDAVKPPRAQPKNLKMRFRPVGSLPAAPETLGSSSESEAEAPSFKQPPGTGEERKRKHHHTEGDATQAAGLPRKKSKKHSQEGEEEQGHKKSKKSHKDREEKKSKKPEKA